MSSPVIINIGCEVYLIRFLEKIFGPQPISFPKKHDFNSILDFLLQVPPLDYHEPDYGDKTLRIKLPYFEDKDVRSYNYLSNFRQRKFEKRINQYFKITYRGIISKYILLGFDRNDSIELFMEEYNLPVDCLDTLEKDYHRYLVVRRKRKLFKNRKNSSDKSPCFEGKEKQ